VQALQAGCRGLHNRFEVEHVMLSLLLPIFFMVALAVLSAQPTVDAL
jgi:hypothetical protein